jgi:AcrR family transcriptional regulator
MSSTKDGAPRPYHHGDLRAALIAAAEAELAERGIEAFSLRSVAKRAGVSHAAPAHHFGDAAGLLTALAAEGFRQFLATQHAREARAGGTAEEQLLAAGLGYVEFAAARPTLFRLIFSSERPDFDDPDLSAAAQAAFGHLVAQVQALSGRDPHGDAAAMVDVVGLWAVAHGLGDLLASKRLQPLLSLGAEEREKVLTGLLRRMMPVRR